MTAHQGQPLTAELAPVVLLLVANAREGQLAVCAGAGLSRAADADLPSGERLGELLDQRLSGRVAGYEAPANTGDLLAGDKQTQSLDEAWAYFWSAFETCVRSYPRRERVILMSRDTWVELGGDPADFRTP
jgi:hypothetical protein